MKNQPINFFLKIASVALVIPIAPLATAQLAQLENPDDDSTITYSADYFAENLPVSANDMLNQIPGIGLALRGGGGGGGRGLGSGEGEILTNGKRITGKTNAGQSQLSRISANQVDYIEIIRGTSEELGIRERRRS